MFSKMLVPLDGSDRSEALLANAKELAGRLDMAVVLLHLYAPAERELVSMRRIYIDSAVESVKHQLAEAKKERGSSISVKSPAVKGEVKEGYAAEEILSYAEQNNVDLILISTHGFGGIRTREWAFGSVTEKVLRRSKIPVWLVRARVNQETVFKTWPKRKILVPLDGSDLAEQVLPHIEALATKWDSALIQVTILAVCEPMILPSYYPLELPLNWDDHMMKSRQVEERYVNKIEKRLKDAGLTVKSEVLVGKVADEIVQYADANEFDIIAMTTHGRSGISRWAFGSVSEKVMRRTCCQFLLVRPV